VIAITGMDRDTTDVPPDANYEFGPNVQVLDVGTLALDFIDNLVNGRSDSC
jgi:hypothetical protein